MDHQDKPPAMSGRASIVWDAFVAVGMLLALETQLRAGAAKLGPGETLIVLWLAPIVPLELMRRRRDLPGPLWDLARFWAALAAALSLGVIVAIVRNVAVDWSLVLHDAAAYALLATLTFALTAHPRAAHRLHQMQWIVILAGALLLALQLANAEGLFALPGVSPWYWDRMRGWSDNPNQFALLCLLVGFLAVAQADRVAGIGPKLLASVCAMIAIGAGLQSKSDAFFAVLIAGLALFASLKLGRAIVRAERRGVPAAALSLVLVASLGLSACLVTFLTDFRVDPLSLTASMGRHGSGDSEEAALRVYLWKESIKVGMDSFALGLGPGPHLEIPPSILAGRRDETDDPIDVKHPKPGLAANFEAHNTVLELFVQGGLLAVVSFMSLGAVAIYRSWRAGLDGLIVLLFTTVGFAVFHDIFRHPMVWFAICVALAEPARALAPAWRRRRGIARPIGGGRAVIAAPAGRPIAAQPDWRD